MTYTETKQKLQHTIDVCNRAHNIALDNGNPMSIKATSNTLSKAYKAMSAYITYASCTSDIAYMANHIGELDEADFDSVWDYSSRPDETVLSLCDELLKVEAIK